LLQGLTSFLPLLVVKLRESYIRTVKKNAWKKYQHKNNAVSHDNAPWDLRPVDHKTISEIIHSLKVNKAAGLDKIPARLIRDAQMELTPSIAYLVNK
jgi:hypothetical protein